MLLDLVLVVIMIVAIIKGYQRGLIVGVFSLVGIIIGLAAAIKLSAVVAGYIGKAITISHTWLPIISFIIVFIIVVLLVRLGANMLQKTVEVALLGWVNRLGGILLYIAIYLIIYSVILFYAEQVNLVKPDTIHNSVTYTFIQPWGPKVINGFASIIPVFKNMFTELQSFFEGVSQKMS